MSTLSDLVDLLEQSTERGSIDWKFDNESRATTAVNGKLIEVLNYVGLARIVVRNSSGLELDSEQFSPGSKYHKKIFDLIEKVRRRSLGVDEALSDIFRSLQARV